MDRYKDSEKFIALMAMLSENFGQKNTKLKIELYFNALKDFTIGQVEKAVYQAVKTLRFFPKVAELRELIEGDRQSRALLAWRKAIDTRDYYYGANFIDDPIIPYCIRELFGTYMQFCEKTIEELKWEEKRFLDLYKLAIDRPDLVAGISTKMKGFFQEDNERKGFLEHVPPVPKIETKVKKVPEVTMGEQKNFLKGSEK